MDLSLRSGNIPQIDDRYWIVITLASITGCNLGDCCSYYFGWNHWIGLGPLALLFGTFLFLQDRVPARTELWYWSLVLILRAAATNLADLLTHTYNWPYGRVLLCLGVLQVVAIALAPKLIRFAHGQAKPAIDGWYWLCLLTAGTFGTALGDWVADEAGLGTGLGTGALAAVFLFTMLLRSRLTSSAVLSYWLPIVAIRAAGTTAGDWVAFSDKAGLRYGAGLGLALSTVLTMSLFLAPLLFWKRHDPEAIA